MILINIAKLEHPNISIKEYFINNIENNLGSKLAYRALNAFYSFVNGMFHDNLLYPAITLFNNKRIIEINRMKNSKLNDMDDEHPAIVKFYDNGKIHSLYRFKNGIKNNNNDKAAIQTFHENGEFMTELYYEHGKLNNYKNIPACRMWNSEGILINSEEYLNGSKV